MLLEADRLGHEIVYHPFSVSESVEKKDVLGVIPSLGDESAIRRAELLRKYVLPHKNLIYSICIKYTFNQEDVEDNYQEALINFFKYMDSYDPRLMTDLNNRNRNRLLPDENVDVSELKSTLLYDDEPSEACLGIDNYEQYYNDDILWALRRLKPIYREPLLLQQAGYKIGEITDILHRKGMLQSKNIETVKSRLFLAKNQLRNLLTRDGEKRMG